MTFSIDNYSLGLCDDHYIIGHFNDLSPEDQRTVLAFLDNMESLKKALPSDDSASDELIAYADDVVNAMANHILTTSDTNYRGRLAKIEKLNHMFGKTDTYRDIFANRVKQTTLEAIRTEKDKDIFIEADYKGYLEFLEEHCARTAKETLMVKTYSVAVTDGGYGPVDIKINLTFQEALKECLSHLEDRDIKQFCSLYAISTKDHKTALARIQKIIEDHLKHDNDFYYDYDNNGNNNTIINIDLRPKLDKYNDARIEIGGYDFFAFAKPEDNYQCRTVAIPGSTEKLFVEIDPTRKNLLFSVDKGETYGTASLLFDATVNNNQLRITTPNPETPSHFCCNMLPLEQKEGETD